MPAKARTKTEAVHLLSERCKDEMLRECLQAFGAMATAEGSHGLYRLLSGYPYQHSAPPDSRERLRTLMVERLRDFLGDDK